MPAIIGPLVSGERDGVDGHARLPAGSRSAGRGRGRPAAGRPAGQFARHRRHRPGRSRADRGPGPAPAPGPGRACPCGRAQRRHPGDGRGRRRVRRGRHDHADEPGRRAPLPRRRGAHVRRDPRRSSTTRTASARHSARSAGRSRSRPGRIPIAGSSSRPTRSTSASAARRAAARRSSSCATSPRRAVARPSARRSSASCRTSCARRSRRSSVARSCWRGRPRRSTRRRRRGIFRDIHDEAERLQRLVEDVVALNRFGDEAGEVGAEPVLLQRLIPRVVELGGRPLARRHVRDRRRAGAADGHRRPDLRRAGRAQPAVQCREVRRRRGRP